MGSDELVEVYSAGPPDAELIRSVLEGSGVPAVVYASGAGAAYPLTVGDMGRSTVLVRRRDEARARDVISEALSGDLSLGDEGGPT
jgi:hypothetical protein